MVATALVDRARCHYWTQDLYGATHTYIDAVHGFVGTASPLIRGRHLLDEREWAEWQRCIANTVRRCATIENGLVNWRPRLTQPEGRDARMLMQFCHGAPGFVITLAEFPGDSLDDLLLAGGEATWRAGPLTKGSNICHGTGGNGYAFLKLYERTGDAMWLERARAVRDACDRTDADHAARYGQMRYSLWTGDPGFAVFLLGLHQRSRALSDARRVLRRLIARSAVARVPALWRAADAGFGNARLRATAIASTSRARATSICFRPIIVARAIPATKNGWWPRDDASSMPDTTHRCAPRSPKR